MDAYEVVSRYYDLEHDRLTDDVDMYLQFAQTYGESVLVCGVGTGRVGIGIAVRGFETWGFDVSPAMLSRARQKAVSTPNLHLFDADMTSLDLDRSFSLVIMPLDTLVGLATREAQEAALKRARACLLPEGLLIVDVLNPLVLPDLSESRLLRLRFESSTCEGHLIVANDALEIDPANQSFELHLRYEVAAGHATRTEWASLPGRWLYRSELELLLRLAGLIPTHAYGNYDLSQYDLASPRMIVTATVDVPTS